MEIPRQEKAETVPAFVLRACAIMEKTQKSGEGVKTSSKLAEEAADRRERIERLSGKDNLAKTVLVLIVLNNKKKKDVFELVFLSRKLPKTTHSKWDKPPYPDP